VPDPRSPIFPAVQVLGRPRIRLFLVSASILFTELLLIRWVPANIRYVGFFPNFLLIGSFLGIGLGILLGRRFDRLPASPFPFLLFAVTILVANAQLNVQVTSSDELVFGLASNPTAADVNFVVLPLVVLLVTLLMAAISLPLGPLLTSMRPLVAYGIDIGGSLTGIAAFTILSALGTAPATWFVIVAVLAVVLALGRGVTVWSLVGGAAMVGVLYVSVASPALGGHDLWSPYYRVTVFRDPPPTQIYVNGIGHQTIQPVDALEAPIYEQAYRWFPDRRFDRVLIIGAGSGTDTAVALSRGAGSIDAVEIDPLIARLGEEHPDRPYADPRVTVHIDDGRNYLRNSDERYDLVVFALPDSLTLVTSAGNLRLESFLFTDEAFTSVRDHLAPGGLFVLYNWYSEPWLVDRIGRLMEEALGSPPLTRSWDGAVAVLAGGPAVAELDGAPPPGDVIDPPLSAPPRQTVTDDWPFLYVREPVIAPYYLVALGAVLVFAFVMVYGAAKVTQTPLERFSPHFFVLGIAFLLLETKSLATFGLLFGTTWLVNALAFFGILVSVLLAILINTVRPIRRPAILYLALFGSIALAWLVPPESLLIEPPVLRYLLASVIAFGPIFTANLVFTHSFRDTRAADMAFASNLLGAMVGGALEYVSLLTGYRALMLIAAGLYACAWLLATRFRWLGDRTLEASPVRRAYPAPEVAT